MKCAPGSTSGAWISSETTRTPCRRPAPRRLELVRAVWTVPVGLCGLHSRYAGRPPPAVASRNAVASDSGSSRPLGDQRGIDTGAGRMASTKPKNGR